MVIRRLISFLVMMGIPWLGYGANWDYAVYGGTGENTASVESARMQLYAAAATGNEAQVEEALAVIPIDTPDQTGNSALCESVWKNNPKAFYLLRSYGASVNAPCVQNIPNSQRIIFNEAAAAYAAQIQATYGAQQAAATAATTQTDSGAVVASAGGGQTKATAAGAVSYEKRPIYPPKDKGIAAGTWVTGVGVVALIAGGIALALLIGGGGGGSDKSSGGSGSSSGSSGSSSSGGDDCGHGTMQGHDCQCDEGWGYDAARKCTVPLSCDGYSYETHVIPNCEESKTCWSGDVDKYGCWICNEGYKRNGSGGCESDASGVCEGYPSSSVEMTGCKEVYACTLSGGATKYKCVSCSDDYDLVSGECRKKSSTECSGHGTKQGDTCVCESGWTGDNCETEDAEECADYTSSTPIAHCQDVPCSNGKYKPTCTTCDSGYSGSTCQPNSCEGFPSSSTEMTGCKSVASCIPGSEATKYKCTSCLDDYDLVAGECQEKSPSDCSGHGVKEGDTCSCVGNWTGATCNTCNKSTEICQAEGKIYDDVNCQCVQGEACTGYTLTVPLPNCDDAPACSKSVGTSTIHYYNTTCAQCKDGYKPASDGNGCVLNTKVLTSLCQHGSWNDETQECTCDSGYKGPWCDACDTGNGYVMYKGLCVKPTEAYCSGHGSWNGNACICDGDHGYVRGSNYTCNLCAGHGQWKGTKCLCDAGYTGDLCGNCAAGYTKNGDNCEREVISGPHQEFGQCEQGYIVGSDGACSECDEHYTNSNGRCIKDAFYLYCDTTGTDRVEGEVCVCKDGYYGQECNKCAPGYYRDGGGCMPCPLGGQGEAPYECTSKGWTVFGQVCESTGGTYVFDTTTGQDTCTCREGWTTSGNIPCTSCQGLSVTIGNDGPYCLEDNYCGNHGYLRTNFPGNGSSYSNFCKCDYGWVGEKCDQCANGFINVDGECKLAGTCGPGQVLQGNVCVDTGCLGGTLKDGHCTCPDTALPFEGQCYDKIDCGDHGTQVKNTCVCHNGYTGEWCTNVAQACSGHGSGTPCVCTDGYDGDDCSVCATGYEAYEGLCVKSIRCGVHQVQQGNSCVCALGYKGEQCTECMEEYISWNGQCYQKIECQHGTQQKGPACDCTGTEYGGIDCGEIARLLVKGQYPEGGSVQNGLGPIYAESGVNWLTGIGAFMAHERGYTGYMIDRDDDGYLKADGDDAYQKDEKGNKIPVRVGVIDSGFNAQADAGMTHLVGPGVNALGLKVRNMDYGPCRNGDKTYCYAYDDGKMVFYGEDEGDKTVVVSSIKQDDEDVPVTQEWVDNLFEDYSENYDYDPERNVDSDGRHGWLVSSFISGEGVSPNESMANGYHLGEYKVRGVAPHSSIWAVNMNEKYKENEQTSGENTNMFWFNEAMKYYAKNNVNVVNLSWGFVDDRFKDAIGKSAYDYYPYYYVEGFKTAAQNNTIVVQAAGNEHESNPDLSAALPLTTTFTKSDGSGSYLDDLYLTVVSVRTTGVNTNDGKTHWTLEDYSNACGLAAGYCIAAPGGNANNPLVLHTTWDPNQHQQIEDVTAYGTSFATAMVTGGIALLQSAFPNLTSQQIVWLLLHTADKTDVKTDEDRLRLGAGVLDLNAATAPYGDLRFDLAPVSNPSSLFVSAQNNAVQTSSVSVPHAVRLNMMAVLPKAFTAFDALNRPYEMPTSMLFKDTKNQKTRIFKKDFKAFRMQSMQGEVRTSDRLNFKFSNPVLGNNPSVPWGSLKMTYDPTDRLTIGFNYAEHTLYQTGDYFKKNLENPFFKMKEAYGVGAELRLGSKTNVSLQYMAGKNGFYVDEDDEDAYDNAMMGVEMKVSHKITPKLTLGASVGMLDERHAVLGMTGTDAFDPTKTRTYLGGLHLGYDLTPDLAFGMAYYRGYTRTNGHTDVLSFTDIQSEALSFNMTYRLKKARVGLDLTSPLRIRRGNALFDIPVGRHPTDDIVYRRQYRASLRPAAREWDISAFYNRMISDSLNFQTKWGVRLNPEHQKGASPDYFGLFNMNWMY